MSKFQSNYKTTVFWHFEVQRLNISIFLFIYNFRKSFFFFFYSVSAVKSGFGWTKCNGELMVVALRSPEFVCMCTKWAKISSPNTCLLTPQPESSLINQCDVWVCIMPGFASLSGFSHATLTPFTKTSWALMW